MSAVNVQERMSSTFHTQRAPPKTITAASVKMLVQYSFFVNYLQFIFENRGEKGYHVFGVEKFN